MAPPSDPDQILRQLAATAGNGHDLSRGLADLLRHATAAVPSCLAVSLTITRHGLPITVAAFTRDRRGEPVHSSLALDLPGRAGSEAGKALMIYAAAAGAFRSMAPDLIALLDLDPRRAIVDGHLDLPPDTDPGDGLGSQLEGASIIDHALGVLLDRGLLATQAQLELERLATKHNTSVAGAAQLVLDAVRRSTSSG